VHYWTNAGPLLGLNQVKPTLPAQETVMRLIRVLYQSQSNLAQAEQDVLLRELLVRSQANNRRDGITGLLVADDLWFVQILEGAQKVVWNTYERIRADTRHRAQVLLDVRDVDERQFSEWSMSLVQRTAKTDPIFQAHGQPNVLQPPRMQSTKLLLLMRDLAAAG
jgi:hypothetical protein